MSSIYFFFFFFNDTATTEIYPLSLHDALPIYHRDRHAGRRRHHRRGRREDRRRGGRHSAGRPPGAGREGRGRDRKSTRLNSSHGYISYAVFCLKKKK